jgi:4-amino-4-deoxy-L-arabinose transferase-like glycosyltransferase
MDSDLAIYSGGTIFQDSESWGVLPEGAVAEDGMEIMVSDGQVISNSSEFMSLIPVELQANFKQVNLASAVVFVEEKILLGLGFVLLLTIATFAVGNRILKLTKIAKSPEEIAFSIAIGLGVYMGVFFLLGLFSVLYWWVVAGCFVLLTAVNWKGVWEFVKKLFSISIEFDISVFKSFAFWIVAGAGLIFTYNLLDIIRPVPIGWDDASTYLYIPEKISQIGGLLGKTGGIYNWELINFVGAFFKTALYQLFINFWGGMLAVFGVYLFLKQFVTKKTAVILSAFFYTLPLVIFQSSTDLKTDLVLLFFSTMASIALMKWFKSDENGKSWICLAGVLIGIALGIKITAGVLLLTMVVLIAMKIAGKMGATSVASAIFGMLLILFKDGNFFNIPVSVFEICGLVLIALGIAGVVAVMLKKKFNLEKKLILEVLSFFGLVILVMSPWIVKNTVIDRFPLSINTYVTMNLDRADVDFGEFMSSCSDIKMLGNEFATYIVGGGETTENITPLNLLKMPWQMTMNPGIGGLYVDISFVFLGLVPLILWGILDHKNNKILPMIFAFTAFYLTIIIFFLGGVNWYALMGICALLAITGIVFEIYDRSDWREEKILSIIIELAIGISVATVVCVKLGSFGTMDQLAYFGKLIDDEGYIMSRNPGVLETAEVLMEDPGTNIYKVGGATPYYLIGTESGFYGDEALDTYACLSTQYSDSELVEVLRQLNIKYFAIDYTQILEADQTSLYRNRMINFMDFGTKNLETVVAKGDYILFKVP